ncbi:MAG: choline ABC transporter substrate-binding protein [Oceanospirillaceae bacterium]
MKKILHESKLVRVITPIILLTALANSAQAAENTCQTVHFTDPGWTDISSTNALASVVLEGLGYTSKISTLAVPIGFEGMKNNEVDVFLGNWMPAQQTFIEQYSKDDAIDVIGANLTGAKFTLAVPKYLYDAGITDFSDLISAPKKFKKRIYGIEAGAPANQLLQKMIDSGDFGLKQWSLVESGEQGVLSQVKRAIKRKEHIAFLAWEPHPMNSNFELSYLTGGDKYFGANFGGATIQTVTRRDYQTTCPNVGKLLNNLKFTLKMENQMMSYILDDAMSPDQAARKWLTANPSVLPNWLKGVQTIDNKDGLKSVNSNLGLK